MNDFALLEAQQQTIHIFRRGKTFCRRARPSVGISGAVDAGRNGTEWMAFECHSNLVGAPWCIAVR